MLIGCGGQIGGPPGDGDGDGDRDIDGGATSFIDYDPSNIDDSHLTVGTASISINDDVTINTMTGDITGPGAINAIPGDSIFVVVPQADGPTLGVFSWANLDVGSGVSITVEGPNALVFAVNQNVTIDGIIIARGRDNLAGAGGFAGGDDNTLLGGGPGGGGTISNYDAGGGGGGYGAPGGAGGVHEGNPGGSAGVISGSETNVPLMGGAGGGRGGSGPGAGFGGGGGGAVQISARGEVRIGAMGGINVAGGGGLGGDNDEGGGGGGAGGAVLLEARYIVVDGVIAANGGGGGAGAPANGIGQSGLSGEFGTSPATGGTGNQDPGGGSSGGDGAAADNMMGGNGQATNGNSGGGGGSGGRIHIRSREPAAMAGTTSPVGSLSSSAL